MPKCSVSEALCRTKSKSSELVLTFTDMFVATPVESRYHLIIPKICEEKEPKHVSTPTESTSLHSRCAQMHHFRRTKRIKLLLCLKKTTTKKKLPCKFDPSVF